MKAIYIEAFAGISGNMLLGALIDAGVPFDHLASEMKKLHLGEYELINERVNKCGIGKSAAFKEAPPIKPPSMFGLAKSSGALLALQLPP